LNDICIIECPNCKFVYRHYANYFGKVCVRCGCVMEAEQEPEFVKINKKREDELLEKVRLQVRRNITNADRQRKC